MKSKWASIINLSRTIHNYLRKKRLLVIRGRSQRLESLRNRGKDNMKTGTIIVQRRLRVAMSAKMSQTMNKVPRDRENG